MAYSLETKNGVGGTNTLDPGDATGLIAPPTYAEQITLSAGTYSHETKNSAGTYSYETKNST